MRKEEILRDWETHSRAMFRAMSHAALAELLHAQYGIPEPDRWQERDIRDYDRWLREELYHRHLADGGERFRMARFYRRSPYDGSVEIDLTPSALEEFGEEQLAEVLLQRRQGRTAKEMPLTADLIDETGRVLVKVYAAQNGVKLEVPEREWPPQLTS